MKHYTYAGPERIRKASEGLPKGKQILAQEDVIAWIEETHQELDYDQRVIATFVIDEEGFLAVADRHSEHVACAGGEAVLSAGELTFEIAEGKVSVPLATNQSTGYCPDPDSWPAVQRALDRAQIAHPDGFTTEFIFRRCKSCGTLNIIKDGWYVCAECDADLE